VALGNLVIMNCAGRALAVGNPARIIRKLSAHEDMSPPENDSGLRKF